MDARVFPYRMMQRLCATVPATWSEACAVAFGNHHARATPKEQEAVRKNLTVLTGQEASADMGREVCRNFARYLCEFFSAHQGHQVQVTLEHAAHLSRAVAAGRGVLILSAHVGNWELGGIVLHRLGYATSAVALPHGSAAVDRLFNAQRQRCGVEVIPLGPQAARTVMDRLRRGSLVAVLGDREFGDNGLPVTFCQQRRVMPRGPALLSLRTGAPLLPTFFVRERFRRYRFVFDEPIWPSPGTSHQTELERLVVASSAAIERVIRRYPTQWLMFHPVGSPA
jgi:KDO2-lipid IV(A) lauroyltransferase